MTKNPFFILNLDTDGSITQQKNLFNYVNKSIELKPFARKFRIWANSSGTKGLRTLFNKLRQEHPAPWLTFLGSGDFHHLTYFLLESLGQKNLPITMVLIDNHPDWFMFPTAFHCGNWLSSVLKLPFVEQIIMIGQNSSDLNGGLFKFTPLKDLYTEKIKLYPYSRKPSFIPYNYTVKDSLPFILEELNTDLQGKNLYISIDKDSLCHQDAITDWDQGELCLNELQKILNTLNKISNIAGIDICGEKSVTDLEGIFKKLDTMRFFNREYISRTQIDSINEATNLNLLKYFI